MLWRIVFYSLCCSASTVSATTLMTFMKEFDSNKQVLVANGNGSSPRVISDESQIALYPDISHDGHYVAYSTGPDDQHLGIVVKNLRTSELEHWTPAEGMNLHANFSGNGRYLAFSGPVGENGKQTIAIIDLVAERLRGPTKIDGKSVFYTPQLRTVPTGSTAFFPQLSSNGDFVIYQSNIDTNKYLAKFEFANETTTILTESVDYVMSPSISFDDQYIAYTRRSVGDWDIMIMKLSDRSIKQLTSTPYHDFAPTFTVDGDIVYAADELDAFNLYQLDNAVNNLSSAQTPRIIITDGGSDFYAPSFSGDINYTQSELPPLPTPARSSFGVISHNGSIYLAGGHSGAEHTYPPESFSDQLDIFDQKAQSWRQGARMSLARHGFTLAAHGNYLYAFGGFTYSADHRPGWKSVTLIERYDITADKWEVIGHLPSPRSSYALGTVDDKVYIIGGWDSTPKKDMDLNGKFVDAIDVFDMTTEQVMRLDVKLTSPLRRALSAVVVGDEVILVGGLGEGSTHFELIDHVTAFNTKDYTWRELPKLPFATFAPAVSASNDELYVFGGMYKTGPMDYQYVNYIYKLEKDGTGWQNTGRYLSGNKGFSQVVQLDSDTLGILGGHSYDGSTDEPVRTFESFLIERSKKERY